MMKMKEIKKIIEDPLHGKKFYTESNVIMLKKLIEIYNMLHIDWLGKRKIIETVSVIKIWLNKIVNARLT